MEFKFNPWHDPNDGRFTFANRGTSYGSARQSQRGESVPNFRGRGGSFGGGGASGNGAQPNPAQPTVAPADRFDPKNPRNHSVYVVRRGDTLTSIAAKRSGLKASDLAWLNDIPTNRPLRIGQPIKVPNQEYLEAGRRAKNSALALGYYIDTHDGRLPPNSAKPPPLEEQIRNANAQPISRNGYQYDFDADARTQRITGEIKLDRSEGRSRSAQAQAGKPDRRTTDDGGHFIAARFNGPREWFNHFAQDYSFNRGAYRAVEDGWAREVRAGRRVFVDIVPHYRGASKRPYKLVVKWTVDGNGYIRDFPNEKQGQ